MRARIDVLTRRLPYTLRTFWLNPTFAAAALLTLAVGIGANTAVFSVVNAVLLSPLPYPRPDALVGIVTMAPGAPNPNGAGGGIPNLPESASMFVTYEEQNRSFEHIGIWNPFGVTVTGLGDPESVVTATVSRGVLETLDVQPARGRWFSRSEYEPGNPDVVILSHRYWQRRFGADPSVIGRTITLDSRPNTVVGIMPPGFRVVAFDPELLMPLRIDRAQLYLVPFNFQTIARLKPGVTLGQAGADLARLARVWEGAWPMPPVLGSPPRPFESWRITAAARPLKEDVIGNIGTVLWVLTGTIGIVLLIACANVANLLLVRAEGRHQELAVRAALGAGRWRLVRELLVESVWLGMIGGALGVVVAYAGVRLLVAVGPATLPRLQEIGIDLPVLGFALVVSILSGLLFGIVPAYKYAASPFSSAITVSRTGSQTPERHRARDGLVVVQVGLALIMLVSAGLMIRTFERMRAVEPGFTNPALLQTFRIAVPPSVAPTPEGVARVHEQILDAVTAIPGVTAAALTTTLPMEGVLPDPIPTSRSPFRAERDPDDVARTRPMRWFKSVSPGYFRTVGTRLVTGREFTRIDIERLMPVAIVSENLANEVWGSPSAALGQRIRSTETNRWREIVGVVQDVRENGVHAAAPPIVYWPSMMESLYQPGEIDVPRFVGFVVRSPLAGSPALLDGIRRAVGSVSAILPLARSRTMQDIYDASMARTSFTLVMLAIAGVCALVLGVIGIYGVIAYAVAQRTQEIGIRMALGAQRAEVRRMFLRHGLVLAGAGIAFGTGGAAALTRLMRTLLYEVSPMDPLTYVAVPLILIAAAVAASYLPARRASAVDPIGALKAQ